MNQKKLQRNFFPGCDVQDPLKYSWMLNKSLDPVNMDFRRKINQRPIVHAPPNTGKRKRIQDPDTLSVS